MPNPETAHSIPLMTGDEPSRAIVSGVRQTAVPSVSIIMPAFNAERFIEAAIETVLQQTFEKWELLIIDDGSQDRTPAIVSRFAGADPGRIVVLHHPERANRGVSVSRNTAIERARGEFVAFLDADDLWRPAKLAVQLAFMAAHPEMATTYTRSGILRNTQNDLFMPGVQEFGTSVHPGTQQAFLAIALGRAHYAFSSVMVKRDALLEVGCFDQNLRFQNEDRLLVAKLSALHPIALCPEVLCDYRAHVASYTAQTARRQMAPLLFLDVQLRLLRWLRQRDRRDLVAALADHILPQEAMPTLLEAYADATSHRLVWTLLRDYALDSPVRGMQATLRLLLAMAGVTRSIDRERSPEELMIACHRIARRLKDDGIEQIVLYGAGQHTQRLLQSRHLATCEIVGILDDHATVEDIMGIPVWRPAAFRTQPRCATIISSDTLQGRLFRKAKQHGLTPVYCLYS
jgi:glycosyltransferase involved in cell wall biosynthesis